MKSKVRSAEVELEETRMQFCRIDSYLRRRWGQHREAMARFANILQAEVRREWEDRRRKSAEKIDHLERKWVRALLVAQLQCGFAGQLLSYLLGNPPPVFFALSLC